jgi:hypothetical protein
MVVAISLQLIHFPVAFIAEQPAKNSFLNRQQLANSLTLISFFYSQSGEQGNPKHQFFASWWVNFILFRHFGEISPLMSALMNRCEVAGR